MRLQEKVAIVTGAASGIGRSTAMLFAREGARLVLNDIDARGLGTNSMLQTLGERARARVVGNVADEDVARKLAKESISAFGSVDVLVNNAGVHFVKDITDMTVEEWDRLMDINLKSMFLCCKHVIPHMLKQNKGSIVNLASISSFIGQEMDGASTFAYNVTKAGALQLTKSLATRYASTGIRVNCVCPGNVETNILKRETPAEVAEFWRAGISVRADWSQRSARGDRQRDPFPRVGRIIVRDRLSAHRRWRIPGTLAPAQLGVQINLGPRDRRFEHFAEQPLKRRRTGRLLRGPSLGEGAIANL